MNTGKLYWNREEDISKEAIILFRNLSSSNSINIKELYDKALENEIETINNSKSFNKNKNKNIKTKKQLIIEKSYQQKKVKYLEDDRKKITNFVSDSSNDFSTWISYLKTNEGRNELKLESLRKAVKLKNKILLLELSLQIEKESLKKKEREYFEKIQKQLESLSIKNLQMEFLGNKLPPLDFYNRSKFKLDDWQIDVLKKIKDDNSVLVCAPTSSGKTVLSTYFATIGTTVLYIVPSKPLAFQVAAIFHSIATDGIAILVDDFTYYPPNNCRVVVGTPKIIETKLHKLNTFDLAVFDEIHNINENEGESYERIIKWHKGNFLALSATIKNSNEIHNWLNSLQLNRKICYVEYKKRFINIQRHLWNNDVNTLNKLNPLSCLDVEDFNNKTPSIAFTPWDCSHISKGIKSLIDTDLKSPEDFFKDTKRLTLDDAKSYEDYLKTEMSESISKIQLKYILDKNLIDSTVVNDTFNIIPFFNTLKYNKMFPAIAFNTSTLSCKDIFKNMILDLENDEKQKHPLYYENLEFRHMLFREYNGRKESLTKDLKQNEKEDRLIRFEKNELFEYQKKLTERHNKNMKILHSQTKCKILLEQQLRNLKLDYNDLIEREYIEETDMFEKHPNFCYIIDPMKADKIRSIRKKIIKKTGIKVNYENLLLQGLKRGIGLYTKDLPDVYLRIVQELAQNKELGVVISDESLAIGINMPFRTSVIMGWKKDKDFSSLLYHQMSGRAGRRGMDTEGHIVFANVVWKQMMKGELETIQGNSKFPTCYSVLQDLMCDEDNYENMTKNKLIEFINPNLKTDNIIIPFNSDLNNLMKELVWKLRDYNEKSIYLVDKLDDFELWLKGSSISKIDIIKVLGFIMRIIFQNEMVPSSLDDMDKVQVGDSELISSLLDIFRKHTISKDNNPYDNFRYISKITEIANVLKIIHNHLIDELYFKTTVEICNLSFNCCKHIIYKYHDFNEE